jgi:hypothetical protein
MKRSASRVPFVLAAAVSFAACAGEGSDIGPRLPRLPDASSKVQVFDGTGLPVTGAAVTIVGTNARAVTGRGGRGDLFAAPRGRVLVRVDGELGAALSGDRLPVLQVAVDAVGGDLPRPFHLPDLPTSATATVPVGLQTAATTVTGTGGSITIGNGSSVGLPSGAANVTVRLGELPPHRLPGDLPLASSGALLLTRGLFVDPIGATFAPGADLVLPDDLLLGTGTARVFRLDPATGEWQELAQTATASGGSLTALGAVAGGGIYVVGVEVSSSLVRGRVVDAAGAPVRDVQVAIDQHRTTSDAAGLFVVPAVASLAADGSPRSATGVFVAGPGWLPVQVTATAAIGGSLVEFGDVALDTVPVGNLRAQNVIRARADGRQPARLSTVRDGVAIVTTADRNGQALFEDVPRGFFGTQEGRPRLENTSSDLVFYGQALGFLEVGRRWVDFYQFLAERTWFIGSRRTRAYVCDAVGGGPIEDAELVQGSTPGQGRVGGTREGGTFFVVRDFAGRATATKRSARDGQSITHAYSIVAPDADHLEFPLRQVLRTQVGGFDRFGIVAGAVTGANPSRLHQLIVTRWITRQQWWSNVVDAEPLRSVLPVDVDPAATHDAYRVGVDAAGGHVAIGEAVDPGGARTLERLGFAIDVEPVEGAVTARDIALEHAATATFAVPGGIGTVDPNIDLGDLSVALAFAGSGGVFVDAARDLRGNHSTAGGSLSFTLPPLAGALDGGRWVAVLQGQTATGGVTYRHASMLDLPTTQAFTFPAFPTVVSPAPGEVVSADGFTVSMALPAGCVFGELTLKSLAGGDTLLWQVVVPRATTEFPFVTLPSEAASPLQRGRTYELTLTAWYGALSTGSPDPYRDLVAFAQTIPPVEAGLRQIARVTLSISTAP